MPRVIVPRGRREQPMKTTRKIWLGVGAVVVAGTGAAGALAHDTGTTSGLRARSFVTDTAIPQPPGDGFILAQHTDHPEAGTPPAQGGEGGEGNAIAKLPPDLAFAV